MANEFLDTNITGDLAVTGTITGDGSGLTGLPGGGDMTLAGVQTVTGAKSFDDGKLIVKGSTSGTTTIKADATAGTTVATLPAATGTIAYSTVPYGGTGAATFTDGGVIIGNGTGALQATSAGTAGHVLTSNGAGVDPTFQAATGGGITALTGNVTASGTGSVAATIAAGAVDIAMLSATGTPSSSTYLRGDNSWATVSGSGDVVGPASATDNAVARFDATTGKLIQNSVVTIADTTGNMAGVGTLNTHTIPGGTGTLALTSNITGTNSGTNTGDQTITLTGDVTGSGTGSFAATVDKTAISGKTLVTVAAGDSILIGDASDTGNLKKIVASDLVLAVASTDNAVARFDSTAGQVQNSVVTIADTSGNVAGVGTLNAHTIPGGTDTFAMLAATQTLTNKRITARVGTTASSATPTINTDNYDLYTLTAQAADITSMTTNLSGTPTTGQWLDIWITGTAARAITWGASFGSGPATLPTTTVTTKTLYVRLMWDGSIWRCMATGSNP